MAFLSLPKPFPGKSKKKRVTLTELEKKMYSAEQLMNFRWLSHILATESSYVLSDQDVADPAVQFELSDIGQFTEVVYSPIPLELLFSMTSQLVQPQFPLEGYDALLDAQLIRSFKGSVADLQALAVYRPKQQQIVLAFAGTSNLTHAAYDLVAVKHKHPSGGGLVHLGFWSIYEGLCKAAIECIEEGLSKHKDRVKEVVITGHSLGGALSYLLVLDIITGRIKPNLIPQGIRFTLAVFGAPRAADTDLVQFWRKQVEEYKKSRGESFFAEYSVKGYNDGVPALPPKNMGWRHFTEHPMFLRHGKLYRIPASECERTAFQVADPENPFPQQPKETEGGMPDVPPPPQPDDAESSQPVVAEALSASPSSSPVLSTASLPNYRDESESHICIDQQVQAKSPSRPQPVVSLYPKGGHNYYNGRDLERSIRRLRWLDEARVGEEGWEARYLKKERKESHASSQSDGDSRASTQETSGIRPRPRRWSGRDRPKSAIMTVLPFWNEH